jgi:ATP-dependent DNA helicase RecQ
MRAAEPRLFSPSEAPADAARQVLAEVFGYDAFRGLQQPIVEHTTRGGDSLVLMPTGGGKSLCYQVPAIVRHRAGLGVAVVVSPLIALMHDQVGALEEAGVHAAFLNSTLESDDASRIEREMMGGRLVLLYAAPERLATPRMLAQLDSLHERGPALDVRDRRGALRQSVGPRLREDYLKLSVLAERYPGRTADRPHRHRRRPHPRRHCRAARPADARIFVSSFDRPNIRYAVVGKDRAREQLLAFLRDEHAGDAGIVYCQSRKKVDETAAWLNDQGIAALPYHAGLEATVRQRHQDRFLREDGLVMVATIAFGMGIDKPDVRFVAHLDLPEEHRGLLPGDRPRRPRRSARRRLDGVRPRRRRQPAADDRREPSRRGVQAQPARQARRPARPRRGARLPPGRLLAYFGEASSPCGPLQNACDNCRRPGHLGRDRSLADGAQLRLPDRAAVGASLRRGAPDRRSARQGDRQGGAARPCPLSTFGIGAAISEAQWRSVIRQLVALGHLASEGEYGTLALTASSRAVLKGEVTLLLREASESEGGRGRRKRGAASAGGAAAGKAPPRPLDAAGLERFAALKACAPASPRPTTCPPTSSFTTPRWPRWPRPALPRSTSWPGSAAWAKEARRLRRGHPARARRD